MYPECGGEATRTYRGGGGGTPYTCIRSMSRIPPIPIGPAPPLSPLWCFISDTYLATRKNLKIQNIQNFKSYNVF